MDKTNIMIYQAPNGAIEFRGDFDQDTVWATQKQICELFGIDQSVVSRHIAKSFRDNEVDQKSNMQKMHNANSDKPVIFYSLDVVLSVGYKTNSKIAINFRRWVTETIKQHATKGYTINKNCITKHYQEFLSVVEDLKSLIPAGGELKTIDALELIQSFAHTWFSLDAYDTQSFPKKGFTQNDIGFTSEELHHALTQFKQDLMIKKQATELFGQEKHANAIHGIVGNIFQTFDRQELYPTIEEKAAHLLYFMVKDHPFTDGNKRSGAFSFIWFLKKAGVLSPSLTPEALTTLTLLVAESKPEDKDKLVGLILLLLRKDKVMNSVNS